jgi:hypothetical protein
MFAAQVRGARCIRNGPRIALPRRVRVRHLFLVFLLTSCTADDTEESGDEDLPALEAGSCTPREQICHFSDNNCSYPGARRCDPLPRAYDRIGHSAYFPIRGDGHVLEDSLGEVIGIVTDDETRLNFGQRRTLHGTRKVLAFAVATTSGTRTGWINESAIGRDLSFMPDVRGRDPGGSYSTWRIVPADNAPYLDGNGDSLKVVRDCGPGRNATDYLNRNGHSNLIFNLPGHEPPLGSGTIDSYPNDRGFHFHRAQNQESIERPLYSCRTGSPVRVQRTLRFLYGYIGAASNRHGWMAMPNLVPGP